MPRLNVPLIGITNPSQGSVLINLHSKFSNNCYYVDHWIGDFACIMASSM